MREGHELEVHSGTLPVPTPAPDAWRDKLPSAANVPLMNMQPLANPDEEVAKAEAGPPLGSSLRFITCGSLTPPIARLRIHRPCSRLA